MWKGKEMRRFIPGLCLALLTSPAFAEGLASGDQITAAIAGNTVQGSMVDAGDYTEFYGADGTIRGDGYTGTWTVTGDEMCFDYGEGADCWAVRIAGESVTWVKDGKDDGTGTIVAGNPNGF
jgi:hypothetical protein